MDDLFGQYGLGGYMDQNVAQRRPQNILKLEDTMRLTSEEGVRRDALLKQLMEMIQKANPKMSPMEVMFRAHGMLGQQDIRDTNGSIDQNKDKLRLLQPRYNY